MNRRHKAILFAVLVLTGSALLTGAQIREAIGMLMLGAALAWAVGSDSAAHIWSWLRSTSNVVYRWLRVPLVFAFSGCVLGLVLVLSRANPVAAVASMCALGIIVSPLVELPRRSWWVYIAVVPVAGVCFLGAVIGLFDLFPSAQQFAEQAGATTAYAGIAFVVGIFWLSKASKLIASGVRPCTSEPAGLAASPKRSFVKTRLFYASLLFGLLILVFLISSLSFSASSDWSYGTPVSPPNSGTKGNIFGEAMVLLALASWPYWSWKKILSMEPNSELRYVRRHQRVTSTVGTLFAAVMSGAITIGVQNGSDRRIVDRITESTSELVKTGGKISAIKQRELKTTGDYIQAYSEIEPLLDDFDGELQKCSEIQEEAKSQDEKRGPVNVQRMYAGHASRMETDSEALGLFREISQLDRREVQTINLMANLPEGQRVRFWNDNFKPLVAEEESLSAKFSSFREKVNSERSK